MTPCACAHGVLRQPSVFTLQRSSCPPLSERQPQITTQAHAATPRHPGKGCVPPGHGRQHLVYGELMGSSKHTTYVHEVSTYTYGIHVDTQVYQNRTGHTQYIVMTVLEGLSCGVVGIHHTAGDAKPSNTASTPPTLHHCTHLYNSRNTPAATAAPRKHTHWAGGLCKAHGMLWPTLQGQQLTPP